MSERAQPNAGVGIEITVEVGRFECTCGNELIQELPIGKYVEMTMATPNYPFALDSLDCKDCGREWALVDDGVHWESRKSESNE